LIGVSVIPWKFPATYRKIRQGALARCQENQLYGLVSFLVGADPFAGPEEPVFMGKSAIFAPLDFTPRFTGVMTELGSAQAEGVITAEWDYPALQELWRASETPLRREMPLEQVGLLAQVYGRSLTLDDSAQLPVTAALPSEEAPSEDTLPGLGEETPSEEETTEPAEAPRETYGEDILSVVTPILPTEPPIISLAEPEEEASSEAEKAENMAEDDTQQQPEEPIEIEEKIEEEGEKEGEDPPASL